MNVARVFWVGSVPGLADALAAELGTEVSIGLPNPASAGDVVFLATRLDPAMAQLLPGGNAFVACRVLKEDPRVRVFLVADAQDRYSVEIARFCLADGCVHTDGQRFQDLGVVRNVLAAGQHRTNVDDLLAAIEGELNSDTGRHASALQRMYSAGPETWVVEHLTDAATGLFSGPFAAFKLEEEFKRASRFHQPLTLLLVELGPADRLPGQPDLDACLAEAASVFLTECRDLDILGRFTESVFMLLLPGTGSAGATILGRRILRQLEEREFARTRGLRAVGGLVTVPDARIRDRSALLVRAEACLRLARQGRSADGLCVSSE